MKSKYPAAVEAVRDWIGSENLKIGTILPSAGDLAARLGFTPATMLRACQILVSRSVLDREGYKLILRVGKPVVSESKGLIQVISYLEDFSRAAGKYLTERGVRHRLIELSYTRHLRLPPILKKAFLERPAGLILWSKQLDEPSESLLQGVNFPTVVCTESKPHLTKSLVQPDAYRGVEKALRHLYELGHRQIAHVPLVFDLAHEELIEHYRNVCLGLGLRSSSSMIWRSQIATVDGIQKTLSANRRRYPEVTALFCTAPIALWATRIFSVPEELSVVAFGALADGLDSRPALTRVVFSESDGMALWACTELISQLQTIAAGRPRKLPSHTMFVPDLVSGGSARAIVTEKHSPKKANRRVSETESQQSWEKIYPFLKKHRSDNWLQLDLSKLANHSMTRQHGWLGDEPLQHFPPGLRSIHGVPFRVLDEAGNGGRGVVTFRSPHSHSAGDDKLPVSAHVRVDCRVRSLYFLHGCGYALPVPFARYSMHYGKNDFDSVALLPLGFSDPKVVMRLGGLRPNVQDWWPVNKQEHFPHAHYATVFNPADPLAYDRTIYSLEWVNPRPNDEVAFIQIRVDPRAGPALALIAVTALLSER
jgi:DNA-binding LacI/PurR family transcriptional regulator